MKPTPEQLAAQQAHILQSAIEREQRAKQNKDAEAIVQGESTRLDNEAARSGNIKKLCIGVLVAIVLMAFAYQNQTAKAETKTESHKTISN